LKKCGLNFRQHFDNISVGVADMVVGLGYRQQFFILRPHNLQNCCLILLA